MHHADVLKVCTNSIHGRCSEVVPPTAKQLLFSLCRAFFDHSMHSALPLGIYLATKFWMYTTWFYWFWNDILLVFSWTPHHPMHKISKELTLEHQDSLPLQVMLTENIFRKMKLAIFVRRVKTKLSNTGNLIGHHCDIVDSDKRE